MLPQRILWLTVLAAVLVLAVGEGNVTKVNASVASVTETPLKMEIKAPPKEAVTDFFKAPLAAFKAKIPGSSIEETTEIGIGKAENSTETTASPPFSNLWFNAGQSLGSAANSLTGWFNNRRLIPPVFTTTTTTSTTKKPAEVIVRLHTQPSKRRLVPIDVNNEPHQGNRIRPHVYNIDDFEEEDDEDDEYDDEDEFFNENRFSNKYDSEEDDDDDENDEEEPYQAPVKRRPQNTRGYKNRPRLNSNKRIYDEEDEEDVHDGNYVSTRKDDDLNLLNRIKQLIQSPTKKKQEIEEVPVKVLQILEELASKTKKKNKKKKPSKDNSSYQLIPISEEQVLGLLQKQKKTMKKNDTSQQFIIPLPQTSNKKGSKKPVRYVTVPWSQLGLVNSEEDSFEKSQQNEPIIVRIPQFNKQVNRKNQPLRNPSRKSATMHRKGLRTNQRKQIEKEQIVQVLSQENIQEILTAPTIPPSRTPQAFENLPVTLVDKKMQPEIGTETAMSLKPTVVPEAEEEDKENDDDENDEDEDKKEADTFIIVGADDGTEVSLGRRFLQSGNSDRFFHRQRNQRDRE